MLSATCIELGDKPVWHKSIPVRNIKVGSVIELAPFSCAIYLRSEMALVGKAPITIRQMAPTKPIFKFFDIETDGIIEPKVCGSNTTEARTRKS